MAANAILTLNPEARRRLWLAYEVILDCARCAQAETADDGGPCPDSSPAASMVKRLRKRQLKRESDERNSQSGEKLRQ